MKRFLALLLCVVFAVCIAVPVLANDAEDTVIDLGVKDMGNGITCQTTLTLPARQSRAMKTGTLSQRYTWLGNWIATVELTGTFSYNGVTATAINVSSSHSVASGWSYVDQSVWPSGSSANLSATLTSWGNRVPVSARLSCAPDGTLF